MSEWWKALHLIFCIFFNRISWAFSCRLLLPIYTVFVWLRKKNIATYNKVNICLPLSVERINNIKTRYPNHAAIRRSLTTLSISSAFVCCCVIGSTEPVDPVDKRKNSALQRWTTLYEEMSRANIRNLFSDCATRQNPIFTMDNWLEIGLLFIGRWQIVPPITHTHTQKENKLIQFRHTHSLVNLCSLESQSSARYFFLLLFSLSSIARNQTTTTTNTSHRGPSSLNNTNRRKYCHFGICTDFFRIVVSTT